MRYWDSSAIVPLLVHEPETATCMALFKSDPEVAVWWGTQIECVSALVRRERTKDLSPTNATRAAQRLTVLSTAWTVAEPSEEIRTAALRFLRLYPLRAADATQLAAAFILSGERAPALELVCLDSRLRAAAAREGFPLLPDL